jgi:probable HAF family extracellular repeat protein
LLRHAFLWERGVMKDLGTLPGGTVSGAFAINERGQVVGSSRVANGETHAALWEPDGTIIDLGTLVVPSSQSLAFAVNESGQAVGWSSFVERRGEGLLWDRDTMTKLGTLSGGQFSRAFDINDRGQVVGYSDVAGGLLHACIWERGRPTDVFTLTALASQSGDPLAINNLGQVVGLSKAAANPPPGAFLWERGNMIHLNPLPGGLSSQALDIKDLGEVVGRSDTATGEVHAVLWRK